MDSRITDKLMGKLISNEKYSINEILGSGAYGIVYKGTHLLTNESVAIKVRRIIYF